MTLEWDELECGVGVSGAPDLVLERGSLTARLKRLAAPRSLVVRVLREGAFEMMPFERERLQVESKSPVRIREVILGPQSEPWVFARTVIPAEAMAGEMGELVGLGTRPLGDWLFSRDDVQRGPMEVVYVNDAAANPALFGVTKTAGPIWGRHSLFHVDTERLLVSEYFLPLLWQREQKVTGGRT